MDRGVSVGVGDSEIGMVGIVDPNDVSGKTMGRLTEMIDKTFVTVPDGARRVNDPVVPGATCGSVDHGTYAL